MLSRIISLHSRTNLRLLSQIPKFQFNPHYRFSTTNNNNNNGSNNRKSISDLWKMSQENDNLDDIFGTNDGETTKLGNDQNPTSNLWKMSQGNDNLDNIFGTHDKQLSGDDSGSGKLESFSTEKSWAFGESEDGGGDGGVFDEFGESQVGGEGGGEIDFQPWKAGVEADEDRSVEDVFGIEDETGYDVEDERTRKERAMVLAAQKMQLEQEEQALLEAIKGPDRAFGDLIAASGITDAMLDSLIALKNFQDIQGLPPLREIEDERYLKTLRKSSRYEIELQKQEDAAKARVRKVDEKGRAYGTGKRKCSIAKVWIEPGEGKFCINNKEFDVYFPMLDHRAALLRPFSETKTLGLWDVKCAVKGGGVSGQVDAIRLGVSRALQNWEPGLRPPLREAGFLTRDPRIVERKKPGKAKARKSFQWVKR